MILQVSQSLDCVTEGLSLSLHKETLMKYLSGSHRLGRCTLANCVFQLEPNFAELHLFASSTIGALTGSKSKKIAPDLFVFCEFRVTDSTSLCRMMLVGGMSVLFLSCTDSPVKVISAR